jgi:hypothetical protein
MTRKTIIALAAATVAMLALPTSNAMARAGGGFHGGGFHSGGFHGGGFRAAGVRVGGVGFRGARFGGFRAGFFPRHRFFVRGPYFASYYGSCWRWVPTGYGLQRVWVCGGGYWPYY